MHKWIEVALSGSFWGGAMLLWDSFGASSASNKSSLSTRIGYWALAGFLFGFWTTFGWQGFQWPLVMLNIVAVAIMMMFLRQQRAKSRKRAGASMNISDHSA